MLTDHQRRRYARHVILPLIGEAGQAKLLRARVLVIGAGGLGSALLSYLAASGIGHLGIADGDRVELSNLQRQILHETADIGRLKVESARDRLEENNPDIDITLYPHDVDAANIEAILKPYDIVADGCDNFATRFLVADNCAKLKKPLVSAAVSGFGGQLSTFKPYLGAPHPSYRDLVPALPPEADNCSETGVVGAVCGVLGSLQALEVIKEIAGIGESLSGTLIRYDGLTQEWVRSKLSATSAR